MSSVFGDDGTGSAVMPRAEERASFRSRAVENEVSRDQPERASVRFGIQSSLELSNRTLARSG